MNYEDFNSEFEGLTKKMVNLMRRKNAGYAKGDDPFKNLRRHGTYGIVVRMDDKISRLDSLTNPGLQRDTRAVDHDESIEDNFIDEAVYSLLGIMMHREENRMPKKPLTTGDKIAKVMAPRCQETSYSVGDGEGPL